MTVVAPSTGARVRRNALTAIEARVLADSCITINRKENDGRQPVGQAVSRWWSPTTVAAAKYKALTFALFSISLITLLALAPVTACCVLANCILAAQMLFCRALVDVC